MSETKERKAMRWRAKKLICGVYPELRGGYAGWLYNILNLHILTVITNILFDLFPH